MVQALVETIVAFVREHESWAVPVAFLVAFGESLCFLSLVWPGTAILVGIAALLAASGVSIAVLWPAVISAALGGAIGYWLSYWLGYYYRDRIEGIWPFTSHPKLIPHGKTFFERWGAFGVFLGHFFGPVRAVIPVVAGMFALRQIPFQVANISSAFIWAGWVILAPYFLVSFKDTIFAYLQAYEPAVAASLFVLAYLNSLPLPLMAAPTLILFVGLGALALYAGCSPVILLMAGVLGALAGDLLAYRLGHRAGKDLHSIWPNSWSPEAGEEARVFIRRWGNLGLISSKFRTTLRSFAPLAAGAEHTAYGPFVVLAILSSLLWAAALLSPYFVLEQALSS